MEYENSDTSLGQTIMTINDRVAPKVPRDELPLPREAQEFLYLRMNDDNMAKVSEAEHAWKEDIEIRLRRRNADDALFEEFETTMPLQCRDCPAYQDKRKLRILFNVLLPAMKAKFPHPENVPKRESNPHYDLGDGQQHHRDIHARQKD